MEAGQDRIAPGQVRVTLRHSLIGHTQTQRRTVWGLGLRRIGASRIHTRTPSLDGALAKVAHLVKVEEVGHDQHR